MNPADVRFDPVEFERLGLLPDSQVFIFPDFGPVEGVAVVAVSGCQALTYTDAAREWWAEFGNDGSSLLEVEAGAALRSSWVPRLFRRDLFEALREGPGPELH